MGGSESKPTNESPAMTAIMEHLSQEKERLEALLKDEHSKNATLEAQLKELTAKANSTEHESLQTKAELHGEKEKVEEMTESLRLMGEYTHRVCPSQWPTAAQFEAKKRQYGYSPEKFHIAISGMSGAGKSSVINALRGLYSEDTQAAPTGVVECTKEVTRYPDPDPNKNIAWFDVPGAGTQSHPEDEYFNDKGLYIFDAILVIFDARFGSTDIAILRQCSLYGIPTYIVRSKADLHVQNGYKIAKGREERKRPKKKGGALSIDEKADLLEIERRGFESATRQSVNEGLTRAGLPIQPVFIVSSEGLLSAVQGNRSKVVVDEEVTIRSDDGNHNDGAGDENEEVDEDWDEDAPYVFDEEKLLRDLIYTSLRTRTEKDAWWLEAMLNLQFKRLPSLNDKIKRWFGNKAPA